MASSNHQHALPSATVDQGFGSSTSQTGEEPFPVPIELRSQYERDNAVMFLYWPPYRSPPRKQPSIEFTCKSKSDLSSTSTGSKSRRKMKVKLIDNTKTPLSSVWVAGGRKVGKTTFLGSVLLNKFISPKWTGSFSGGNYFGCASVEFGSNQSDAVYQARFYREAVLGSGGDWVLMRPMSYQQANPIGVVLVLFSVGSRKSFDEVTNVYLPELDRQNIASERIFLVGTKCDLRNEDAAQGGVSEELRFSYDIVDEEFRRNKFVSSTEAQAFAKTHKLGGYFECSARARIGLVEIFEVIMPLVCNQTHSSSSSSSHHHKKGLCISM
eukprot:TRINITY_DN4236_c0_g1_i1.p1 TRINITY_DN4236_c0_g1~~TRINITY_DN4236_c0_g1_i1.p1  ORF type:complete len:325 (-),score=76.81 TRINITY_DN4236_c0_g1_i1:80-1054(-)